MDDVTVFKLFWISEFDKEEQWLNEMAAKGLALKSIGFCRYTFERTMPNEYGIRFELLRSSPASVDGQDYISFVEDTGAELVGTYMKWVYFRKRVSDGGFELFSDMDSRIEHLGRMRSLLCPIAIINAFAWLLNLMIGISLTSIENILCSVVSFCVTILITWCLKMIKRKQNRLCNDRKLHE